MAQLQQGLTTGEMGFGRPFAQQQSWAAHVRFGSKADIAAPPTNVRFGSKADIQLIPSNVRFTPKSGHGNSLVGCPLCAKSGLMQCSKKRLVDHLIKRQRAGTPLNLNRCYIPNV